MRVAMLCFVSWTNQSTNHKCWDIDRGKWMNMEERTCVDEYVLKQRIAIEVETECFKFCINEIQNFLKCHKMQIWSLFRIAYNSPNITNECSDLTVKLPTVVIPKRPADSRLIQETIIVSLSAPLSPELAASWPEAPRARWPSSFSPWCRSRPSWFRDELV